MKGAALPRPSLQEYTSLLSSQRLAICPLAEVSFLGKGLGETAVPPQSRRSRSSGGWESDGSAALEDEEAGRGQTLGHAAPACQAVIRAQGPPVSQATPSALTLGATEGREWTYVQNIPKVPCCI